MKNPKDKILDVAIAMAEEGGFENVRQREVAARAGVALGTLYKRFSSKHEILAAALERETQTLERKMEVRPAIGETPSERLHAFFKIITKALCRKPKYARAVLKAMASGEPEVASNVSKYQDRMNNLIISAMRGRPNGGAPDTKPTKREITVALYLQRIWFASLVGWSAGLQGQDDVVLQMEAASDLLLEATKGWK